MFSLREGRRRRRVVRLVALRRPRLPVPQAVGRRRLRRPRRHARPPSTRSAPAAGTRRTASPTWTPTTSRRRSASPTRSPASAARRSSSGAATRSSRLLCVQAYNDWMIDEWCAGDGQGPADPAHDRPAVGRRARRRRGAALRRQGQPRGRVPREPVPARPAVGPRQGPHWDPFFPACEETDTVVCMHIGSSSKMPATSPDAPFIVSLDAHVPERDGLDARLHLLRHARAVPDAEDRVLRGPGRLDALRARAGRQALGRAQRQQLRHVAARTRRRATSRAGSTAASSTTRSACANRDVIGMDQICFETDYPHADSTFPHSKEVATEICATGRARRGARSTSSCGATPSAAFGLERFGITNEQPPSGSRAGTWAARSGWAARCSRWSSRTRATRSPTTAGTSGTTSTPAA